MNNSLSLVKIISGLSKTLNIANKLIPLYQEVKPYLGKANKFMTNLNNLSISKTNNNIKEIIDNKTMNNNQPTFFK